MPADAPVNVTVKPVDAAPVTVAVPAKPGDAVDRGREVRVGVRDPALPTTTESLPPNRSWNGEVYVTVPPPALARPETAFVNSKLRGVGTAVIVTGVVVVAARRRR